jgi:ketosteroid isomerase-like protein
MSQENVEIVRKLYAAFNDRRLDAITELWSSEGIWYPNRDDPEQEPRRGCEEVAASWKGLWEALPGVHTEIEETIDAGSDVVAVVRHTARVPDSNSEVERHEAHVWSVEGGMAVRLREYSTRAQALEAAGLSE